MTVLETYLKKRKRLVYHNECNNQTLNEVVFTNFKLDMRSRNASAQNRTVFGVARQIPDNVSPFGYPFRNKVLLIYNRYI